MQTYFLNDFKVNIPKYILPGTDSYLDPANVDFEVRLFVPPSAGSFVASHIGGKYVNCKVADGQICIIADGHQLAPGEVWYEAKYHLPDSDYPDGYCTLVEKSSLGLSLTTSADVEVREEQEASAAESQREQAEANRAAAEQSREQAETNRVAAENLRKTDEEARKTAETQRVTAENERKAAEAQRAKDFEAIKQEVAVEDRIGIFPFNSIVEAHDSVIDGAPSYDTQFPSAADGAYRHIIFDKSRKTFLWEIHAGDYPDCPAGDAYTSWKGSEEYVSEGHPRTDRLYRMGNELYRWDGTTLRSYSADIAAKQDALTTSDDLMISQDNELSLTDKAKYATFDAQWTAIGGTVVESGKAYSINGGNGTFADAVKALSYYSERPRADLSWLCYGKSLKLLPTIIVPYTAPVNLSRAFQSAYGLDKVVIRSTYTGGDIYVGDMFAVFNSSSVKELDCVLDVSAAKMLSTAFPYSKIEEIRLKRLNDNISFPHSKNLSLASLQYLVENAANTKAITLTVHADVFAKLTDESNTEWHAVAVAALAKNITIATT